MKKLIKTAVIFAAMINGVSYISAEAPIDQTTSSETKVGATSASSCPVTSLLSVATYKKFASDHKVCSAIVAATVVCYFGHKVMANTCSWYRKLVGIEEEEETKTPALMNPARAY